MTWRLLATPPAPQASSKAESGSIVTLARGRMGCGGGTIRNRSDYFHKATIYILHQNNKAWKRFIRAGAPGENVEPGLGLGQGQAQGHEKGLPCCSASLIVA